MINPSSIQFNLFAESVFALFGTINSEGNLQAIEGDLCNSLDLDSKLMIGQQFTELIVWQTDDDNIKEINEAYSKAKEGETAKTSLKFRCSAKELKHIDITIIPNFADSKDELFFCITDVSDLHCQIKEYKDRCDHFLYAADVAEIGLWFWNLETDEIYSTSKSNEFFDLGENDELTFEHILSIVHPEDLEKVERKISESIKNETEFNLQYRVIHSNGNVNWVASQGRTLFYEEVKANTLVGSVRFINDTKAASKELEKIYKREKQAKFEAEKANKTKDFFLALVSHELRSPLNAILGWTNILLKKEVDEKTRLKALETIERSANTQSKLIEDLVDSARVTSGKLKLVLHPLNLFEIVQNVYNEHIPAIEEKNIEHKFIYKDKTIEVIGDTMRLRQVFSNIIGNSIKFTPENGKLIIELKSDGEFISVIFKDNGQGIKKENLAIIFDRFAQGDENYSKSKEGLGLGLSLANILVENHQGQILVESEGLGYGATFIVKLPISSTLEDLETPKNEKTDDREIYSSIINRAHILIVEDNEDSRNVLEIFLSQIVANVQSAESVREAFILLNKPETPLPDLIISDIGMPEEDGYSFIKKIRRSDEYKHIPALALSAFTAEENKTKAYELGFDKYHTKPFDPEQLMQEIIELLEKSK